MKDASLGVSFIVPGRGCPCSPEAMMGAASKALVRGGAAALVLRTASGDVFVKGTGPDSADYQRTAFTWARRSRRM